MKYLLLILLSLNLIAQVPNVLTPSSIISADKINENFNQVEYKRIYIKQDTGTEYGALNPMVKRQLTFHKNKADTAIKLTYNDTMRANNGYCNVEFLIDGQSCPSHKLTFSMWASGNPHNTRTLMNYCSGIPAGDHTFTIRTTEENDASCYFGYPSSNPTEPYWHISAEEVVILPNP